ncbi:MAG: hypothetical protein NTY03_01940 [Candidatus Bathyarchaeota archaeon]|nr:hypothetical protein [Candidatus Bathyarchaeota archaeon]
MGEKIDAYFGKIVARDGACTRDISHQLPLFYDKSKKRETRFCNVDMLIYEDTVKVIFEIEETDFKPTKVFGKFLTSALSRFYNYGKYVIPIDDDMMFIQILDSTKLKPETRKFKQFEYLAKAINERLTLNKRAINYRLYSMKVGDEKTMNEIIKTVEGFLAHTRS